jgi:hypothetical protein
MEKLLWTRHQLLYPFPAALGPTLIPWPETVRRLLKRCERHLKLLKTSYWRHSEAETLATLICRLIGPIRLDWKIIIRFSLFKAGKYSISKYGIYFFQITLITVGIISSFAGFRCPRRWVD